MHPLFVCKFCTPVALPLLILLLLKIRTPQLSFVPSDSLVTFVQFPSQTQLQEKSKEIKA